MNKNLAITVLTWNDWVNTTKCLESIYQSTYKNFDVILVDNNSDQIHIRKIFEWANNKIEVQDEEFEFNPNKVAPFFLGCAIAISRADMTGFLLKEAIATEALSIILLIIISIASEPGLDLSEAISAIFHASWSSFFKFDDEGCTLTFIFLIILI